MSDSETNSREQWTNHVGKAITVTILRRYLTVEDVCPECDGGLRVALAVPVDNGGRLFRLECCACGWTSEALPDPEAE